MTGCIHCPPRRGSTIQQQQRKGLSNRAQTWRKRKSTSLSVRAHVKRPHAVWFPLRDIPEKANCGDSRRAEVTKGKRGERTEHRGFLKQWNCPVSYYGAGHTVCLNLQNVPRVPRASSLVSGGLRVVMLCLCSFIDGDARPALVGDVTSGGGPLRMWWGREYMMENPQAFCSILL